MTSGNGNFFIRGHGVVPDHSFPCTLTEAYNDYYVPWCEATGEPEASYDLRDPDRMPAGPDTIDNRLGWYATRMFSDRFLGEVPAMSVGIAHSVTTEHEDTTVIRTLRLLERSATEEYPVEPFVWSNITISRDDPAYQRLAEESVQAYRQLLDRIREMNLDPRRIRITCNHDILQPPECFNNIRRDYTCSIARDAVNRGFDYNHPMLWVDSDTTFISRNTIPDMSAAIRSGDTFLCHANVQFSGDNQKAPPFSKRTEEQKIAALFSLAIRHAVDYSMSDTETIAGAGPQRYLEDVGTGLQLRSILAIGGIPLFKRAIGETRGLLVRAGFRLGSERTVQHLKQVRLGTSDRRYVDLAATHLPVELPWKMTGDDYVDFTTAQSQGMQATGKRKPGTEMSAADLLEMVDACQVLKLDGQVPQLANLPAAQRDRLAKIITRWGFS